MTTSDGRRCVCGLPMSEHRQDVPVINRCWRAARDQRAPAPAPDRIAAVVAAQREALLDIAGWCADRFYLEHPDELAAKVRHRALAALEAGS